MKLTENILDFIPSGEENAVSARDLAVLLHCHCRDITLSINYLRRKGAVICSCQRGYFKPVESAEVSRFVRTMHSRLKQIKIATLSAEKYLSGGDQK